MRVALVAVAMILLSMAPQVVRAQSDTPEFPDGWLAAVTVRNPQQSVSAASKLLSNLDLRWAPLESLSRFDLSKLGLDAGAFHLGVAASKESDEKPYFFALTPTPVTALADAFDGDSSGDLALFQVAGYEFAAERRGDWTLILPTAQQELLQQPLQPCPPLDALTDVSLRVSATGLRLMQARTEEKKQTDPRSILALSSLKWPPSRAWLDAAVVANRPLMDRIEQQFQQCSVGINFPMEDTLQLILSGSLAQAASGAAVPTASGHSELSGIERAPIATLQGDAVSGGLPIMAKLLLAYSEGRPDVVEAPMYPHEGYVAFEKPLLAAVHQVRWLDAWLLSRLPDDPFESNRIALLHVEDVDAFLNSAIESTNQWNALLDVTDARTKLTIAIDRERLLGPDAPEGVRFTTDVAAALESPPSPETREITSRYYGPGGNYVLRLVPLGGGRVLLGDVDEKQLKAAAAAVVEVGEGAERLTGQAHIDRYAAWKNAVLADYMQDAIGFKPPKPLSDAPVQMEMTLTAGTWRVRLEAPTDTFKALSDYWRAARGN